MKIIYEDLEYGLSIIIPAINANISIQEIARKDVPIGLNYWIVEDNIIPEDRTFREAWELDLDLLGEPDGQGIGSEAWFAEQENNND